MKLQITYKDKTAYNAHCPDRQVSLTYEGSQKPLNETRRGSVSAVAAGDSCWQIFCLEGSPLTVESEVVRVGLGQFYLRYRYIKENYNHHGIQSTGNKAITRQCHKESVIIGRWNVWTLPSRKTIDKLSLFRASWVFRNYRTFRVYLSSHFWGRSAFDDGLYSFSWLSPS